MASGKYLEQKRREAEDKIRQWLRTMSGPWTEPLPEQDKPSPWFNPRTRTAYTGSNRLLLAASGFSDPRFYTVSNIRELDLRIKEGEKPTPLEFWRQTAETDKLDENGFIERDADGRPIKEEVRLERPLYRQCLVYNASQLTGENGLPLPAYDPEPLEYTPRMIGESILNGCGVKFVFNRTSDSFYHQKTDTIHMPPRERFADAAHFYSNAIRHLAESYGQPSRLNFSDRDGDGLLRSQLAAWMIAQSTGLPYDPDENEAAIAESLAAADNLEALDRIFQEASLIEQFVVGSSRSYLLAIEDSQVAARRMDKASEPAVRPYLISSGCYPAGHILNTTDRDLYYAEINIGHDSRWKIFSPDHPGISDFLKHKPMTQAALESGLLDYSKVKDFLGRTLTDHASVEEFAAALKQNGRSEIPADRLKPEIQAELDQAIAREKQAVAAMKARGRKYRLETMAVPPGLSPNSSTRPPDRSPEEVCAVLKTLNGHTLLTYDSRPPGPERLNFSYYRADEAGLVNFDELLGPDKEGVYSLSKEEFLKRFSSRDFNRADLAENVQAEIRQAIDAFKDSLNRNLSGRTAQAAEAAPAAPLPEPAAIAAQAIDEPTAEPAAAGITFDEPILELSPNGAGLTGEEEAAFSQILADFRQEKAADPQYGAGRSLALEAFSRDNLLVTELGPPDEGLDPDREIESRYEVTLEKTAPGASEVYALQIAATEEGRYLFDHLKAYDDLRPVIEAENLRLSRQSGPQSATGDLNRHGVMISGNLMKTVFDSCFEKNHVRPSGSPAPKEQMWRDAKELPLLDPEAQKLVSSVMEPALEPRVLNGLNSSRIFDLPEELGRAACLVTSTPYGFNCFRPNRLNDFAEVYNLAIKKDPLDPAVILPTHILIGLDKQGNYRLIPEDDTCRTQAAVPLGAAKSFLKRLEKAYLENTGLNLTEAVPTDRKIAGEKTELAADFQDRRVATALGALYNPVKSKFYILPGMDENKFARWIPKEQAVTRTKEPEAPKKSSAAAKPQAKREITVLRVPYQEKDEAKKLGALFDVQKKAWIVPGNIDPAPFQKWLPGSREPKIPAAGPRTEFKEKLQELGLIMNDQPILDGAIHRVPVKDARPNGKDGSYKGYADGLPNGWAKNFRTGQELKWRWSGHKISDQELEKCVKENERKRQAEQEKRQAEQSSAIAGAVRKITRLCRNEAQKLLSHPYLQKKSVQAVRGVLFEKAGQAVNLLIPGYIPAKDGSNTLRTIQTITPEGAKFFESGCPKSGAMFIIDPGEKLKTAPETGQGQKQEILIAEGYATACSLAQATGLPAVCAFDAGNLQEAGRNLRKAYPEAALIFCADNDRKMSAGPEARNIGLESARKAAGELGGLYIYPEFTEKEARQGLTDFNDLAAARGLEQAREYILEALQTAKLQPGLTAGPVQPAAAPKSKPMEPGR